MKKSNNLGLALYDKTDLMNITGLENSLNHNMELIDSEIRQLSVNKQTVVNVKAYGAKGGGNAGSLKSWSATGASYKASSNYTGTGYGHVHADSSGNIVAHAPSGYTLRAGTYIVFYGLAG